MSEQEHPSGNTAQVQASIQAFSQKAVGGARVQDVCTLPEHVIHLGDTSWLLWRQFGLRGAGFPALPLLETVPLACADAVDQWIQAKETAECSRKEALAAVEQDLQELHDATRQTDRGRYLACLKARQFLMERRHAFKKAAALSEVTRCLVEKYEADIKAIQVKQKNAIDTFASASIDEAEKLAKLIGAERFREAVIWQNRQAFHSAIRGLLTPDARPTSASYRKKLMMAALYLQRYHLKNDSIGFFGPIGWGEITGGNESIQVDPGQALLAERTTYFEHWGIQLVAEQLGKDRRLGPFLVPKCMPLLSFQEGKVVNATGETLDLSLKQLLTFQACRNGWTAMHIAAYLLKVAGDHFADEADVYAVLESLRQADLISWTFHVPIRTHPQEALRDQIERIDDSALRTSLLCILDELEQARGEVARSAGNADQLDKALARLEATFTHLTHNAATREEGKMYAGRTLVYEDARRDIAVKLGDALLQTLAAPLSLLLKSGSWLAGEVAQAFKGVESQLYTQLSEELNSPVINALRFWQELYPRLFGLWGYCNQHIAVEFEQRWRRILSVPFEEKQVMYRSEDLREQVEELFPAPSQKYRFGRYHSPDIMIDAANVEAIQQDNYLLVLGEFHIAVNTLLAPPFYYQHPQPEKIIEAYERDLPELALLTVPPPGWPGVTTRGHILHVSPKNYRLVLAPEELYSSTPAQVIPLGDCVVEQGQHGLLLRIPDRGLSFDLIEVLADLLSLLTPGAFRPLFINAHVPRITIDRLVLCRESWQIAPQEMTFALERDEASRFMKARQWARAHGMPRFVFIGTPAERKPIYIDFASPISIAILSRAIRKEVEAQTTTRPVTISEMLPDPSHLWLPDAMGSRFTSELRLVALEA